MSAPVVSERAMNRSVLARQLLLQRSSAPLVRALEQVGGLQTQYAPSGYIGLWSRLATFERGALTAALERGRVIQATLMRATIHMVSAADFPLFAAGVREGRREWWTRVSKAQSIDMAGAAAVVRAALADGPRRAADLIAVLAAEGYPKTAWQGVGMWVDLVRVPPSGTWERRRADLYGLADQQGELAAVSRQQGVQHLLRRYLRAFGPAPLRDAATWAGLPLPDIAAAADSIRLRRLAFEDGTDLYDVSRAPIVDPDAKAPVRFIGTWEAILLVHARRAAILPEEYRPAIFSTKQPQSVPTFLVDGAVAGTWRFDSGKVSVTPFAPLPRRVLREVDDEATRIAAFMT